MELLGLYKAILASMNLVVNDEGMVSYDSNGEHDPVFVEKRRLVLPTREILRDGLGDQRVAFHPLGEDFMSRKESSVSRTLRQFATLTLTAHISRLAVQLMKLATDTAKHEKLTPKQSEFLDHVPEATPKTLATLSKILDKINPLGNTPLITLYVRMGAKLNDSTYHRVGVVSLPLLEELEDNSGTVYGVKPSRKADFPTIDSLFLYIFPGIKDVKSSKYSYGSNDSMAPGFDALLHAFINVSHRLNHVVKTFKDFLEDDELNDYRELLIKTPWEDSIDDFAKYRGQIPSLEVFGDEAAPLTATTTVARPVKHVVAATEPDEDNSGFNYAYKHPKPVAAPAMAATMQPVSYGDILPVAAADDEGVDFSALKAHNVKVLTGQVPVMAAPAPVMMAPAPAGQVYMMGPNGYPVLVNQAPMGGMNPAMGAFPGANMMGESPAWMSAPIAGAPPPVMGQPAMVGYPNNPMNQRISSATRTAMMGGMMHGGQPIAMGMNTGFVDPRFATPGYPGVAVNLPPFNRW